jgi:nicotinamide mononucleotide transporter
MNNWIEIVSVVLGLSCVFLASRAKVANFWVGYVYCIALMIMFSQKHLYSSMILQPISLAINIMGHYRWTHPGSEEKTDKAGQLKVSRMDWKRRGIVLGALCILAVIWGLFLSKLAIIWPDTFPAAQTPLLDAFVTMMILLAQWLSAQKRMECWVAWLGVNIANIILYLLAGLKFMPIVSACYLVFAIMGIINWRKIYKEQNNA